MSKSIVILVSPQGETKIETQGFQGSTCRAATKSLELALGQRETELLTSQFYETVDAIEQETQRQG